MLVIVLLVSFFLLLFIGVPISFALSISSFTAVMTTGAIPVINLVQKTFRAIDSFTLLAIPFFVFAGNVMARGGVSKRLTDMAATLVGRMPGGLAHVATLSSTFFGAISGSAPATTSAIGAVMVPEMEKRSYDKAFTAAVVAASGTIGLIIPPSNTMVMYGTLANAHIFSYLLSSEQIPQKLAILMTSLTTNPTMIMFLIMIVLLIAGCFLDNAVAVILLTPIFVNVVQAMNIDICYFGVFLVFVLAIGQVTPPVGLCLFVACDIGKVSIEKISREVLPYVGGLIVTAILLVLFPQIVTWLPSLTKMA